MWKYLSSVIGDFPYDVSDRHITLISNLKDFKVVWHIFVKKLQEKFPQSEEQLHCMLAKSGYQYNWKIGLGFPTESRKLFGEISWLFKALICTGAGS